MTLLDGTYYILSRRMFDMTNFRDWTDKFYAFSKTGEKLSEIDISQVFTSYHYLHCQNDTLVARIGSQNPVFRQTRAELEPFGKAKSLFKENIMYPIFWDTCADIRPCTK